MKHAPSTFSFSLGQCPRNRANVCGRPANVQVMNSKNARNKSTCEIIPVGRVKLETRSMFYVHGKYGGACLTKTITVEMTSTIHSMNTKTARDGAPAFVGPRVCDNRILGFIAPMRTGSKWLILSPRIFVSKIGQDQVTPDYIAVIVAC